MDTYHHLTLDGERALYGLEDAHILSCTFDGPADGESALKECRRIQVEDCDFRLRYPLWHAQGAAIRRCRMEEGCRAALWYDRDVTLQDCTLEGIKALRECDRVTLENCRAASEEFGWLCRELHLWECEIRSAYAFFQSRDITADHLRLEGKYAFQYVRNARISHAVLDTKDAFWHSVGVTVTDSVIKGEYLGWYAEDLHLIRCKLIGTQPLCYDKGLVLEDCEMVDTDLAFENSEVHATVRGEILSIKNPLHGRIEADRIGETILDSHLAPDADCVIVTSPIREHVHKGEKSP